MGIVADVVPNHMCIAHPSNVWWWDVLENGPSSPFARYFDIDWHPPKADLVNKVLLPVLGDQYGRMLENQEIDVTYADGQFHAVYQKPLPLAPRTWTLVLEPAGPGCARSWARKARTRAELESIVTALSHLPAPPKPTMPRSTKGSGRRRSSSGWRRLLEGSPSARESIDAALAEINGQRAFPTASIVWRDCSQQSYRLRFWRVAMDEINYRRFFDINDLAAIRVEDADVFSAVHALIFDLVRQGRIDGLRVDHSDGLCEPEEYFRFLQDACRAWTAARMAAREANGGSTW